MSLATSPPLPPMRRSNHVTSLLPVAEWRTLRTVYPNVLITGEADVISDVLRFLRPTFRGPVVTWNAGDPPPPSLSSVGTLILRDIAELSVSDQQRLLDWLPDVGGSTQVVTMTTVVLWPLVEHGAFLDTLYYRLNVMYLKI